MPLPAPPANGAGGLLELEYANPGAGDRHAFKWHLAHFDQTPLGSNHDYGYDGTGPVATTESGVLATFAALGALWRPYYPPSWSLRIIGIYWQLVDSLQRLPDTPTHTPIVGTNTAATPSMGAVKRIFTLRSVAGRRRRLWLSQVPDDNVDETLEVTPTTGGFDARDRAWMAYLSGASNGAVVAPDGQRFEPVCDVRRWWSRPTEAAPLTTSAAQIFVGPSPPADPQDGWLWVNTSTDPPYGLYVWSVSAGEWVPVAPGAPPTFVVSG